MSEFKIKCIGDVCRMVADSAGSIVGRGVAVSDKLVSGDLKGSVSALAGNQTKINLLRDDLIVVKNLVKSARHLKNRLNQRTYRVCNLRVLNDNLIVISNKLSEFAKVFRAASDAKSWKQWSQAQVDNFFATWDPEWYRSELHTMVTLLNTTLNLVILEASITEEKLKDIRMIQNKNQRQRALQQFKKRCPVAA